MSVHLTHTPRLIMITYLPRESVQNMGTLVVKVGGTVLIQEVLSVGSLVSHTQGDYDNIFTQGKVFKTWVH